MTAGPLRGLLVLDLCHFLAGPYATLALADLGADVIKVEDPDHPDEARRVGPVFRGEDSVYFMSLNWGKRSLGVRLTAAEGRALVLDLVRRADIVVDNYKPGVMAKLGLDHSSLAAVNPAIITCSLTGFGETGSEAARPAYDYTIQARAGVMSLTGEPDGPPGKAGISYVDHSGGLAAALAVVAAVVERDRTGVGRHVDLALYDVQVSMLSYLAAWTLNSDHVTARHPNGAHPSIVPAQTFATKDGHVAVFVGNDPMWARLVGALDDSALGDGAYRTNSGRLADRDALLDRLSDLVATETSEHWVGVLEQVGVPCERVNSLAEALADPVLSARSLVVTSEVDGSESYRHVRGPVPLDPTAGLRPAPRLGADSADVLAELGIAAEEIDRLLDADVIVDCTRRVPT
jgi:crotonobetainyl-CoA:carnitine CoA-transferase CaiB-like acyl-CoA transferase